MKGSKSCFDKLFCSSAFSLWSQKQGERYKQFRLSSFQNAADDGSEDFRNKTLRSITMSNSTRAERLFLKWFRKGKVYF